MIKTSFPITLEIDEKIFKIVVSEPNKKQKEDVTSIFKKNKEAYEKSSDLEVELDSLKNEFEINKQMLKEVGLTDKVSLLVEQKKLNKQIYELKNKVNEHKKTVNSVSELVSETAEKKFDLLVSGEDKEALKKEIENKGVPYEVLFENIEEMVKKEREKK